MEGTKDTVTDITCIGTVTCVECSPFEYCDSLICFSSYVSSSADQPSHRVTIAKLHPKRVVSVSNIYLAAVVFS